MADILPFDLTIVRRGGGAHCSHRHIALHKDGRYLECVDCGAILDPIELLLDCIDGKRAAQAHRAIAGRPEAVRELCRGMSNTAARRDALRQYLEEIEGHNYLKYKARIAPLREK